MTPPPASSPARFERIRFANADIAVLRETDVESGLSIEAAIHDRREMLPATVHDGSVNRPRIRVEGGRTTGAWMHTLRARLSSRGLIGGKDYSSLGFVVPALWITVADAATGLPIAFIEADHLSRVRTAASAAMATDLLAPSNVSHLTHFGAGKISEFLVQGLLLVRPSITTVCVVRHAETAAEPEWFSRLRARPQLATARVAASAADIITTATSSKCAVLPDDIELPRLAHLNLIGSNHKRRQEIGPTLARSFLPPRGLLVAGDPNQAAADTGDFAEAVADGTLDCHTTPTLAAISLAAGTTGRYAHSAARTAFKSVGTGLTDLIVTAGLLERLGLLPTQRAT